MGNRPKQPEAEAAENDRVEAVIMRRQGGEGAEERANYPLFLTELCHPWNLDRRDRAKATTERHDYVLVRVVREVGCDDSASRRRIDLCKRGAFMLKAKQPRQKRGREMEVPVRLDDCAAYKAT